MAWHTAKHLLPLIAVSSYVTLSLGGDIDDTEDKAVLLQLCNANFENQSVNHICHVNNWKNTRDPEWTRKIIQMNHHCYIKFCTSLKLFSCNNLSFGCPELLCDTKFTYSSFHMLKNATKALKGDSSAARLWHLHASTHQLWQVVWQKICSYVVTHEHIFWPNVSYTFFTRNL